MKRDVGGPESGEPEEAAGAGVAPSGSGVEASADGLSATDDAPSVLDAYVRREVTEREALQRERLEAIGARTHAIGWLVAVGVGPAAVLAVILAAFVEESLPLAILFALMGLIALVLKAYRAHQRVRDIERQLADTMDGS